MQLNINFREFVRGLSCEEITDLEMEINLEKERREMAREDNMAFLDKDEDERSAIPADEFDSFLLKMSNDDLVDYGLWP